MACIVFLFCLAAAIAAPAQTVTTVASFDGANGSFPESALVQGLDGNLYGATYYGGTSCPTLTGCGSGTLFKMTPTGTITSLYSFCAQANCADGSGPSGLGLTTGGNFYGTTAGGGTYGNGTFFKITPGGKLTTIYNFCRQTVCPPGSGGLTGPGAIIQATDGNFYGTAGGGANSHGAVFKITPGGTLTTLYSFCAQAYCGDGTGPNSPLVEGTDGNLYGTTSGGGAFNPGGTIFRITREGSLTTVVFWCCGNGFSVAGLVQGTNGNFYGTTEFAGASLPAYWPWCDTYFGYGCGTVFEMTPEGTISNDCCYVFMGFSPPDYYDGQNPAAPLVQATDGNFYGTTINGGIGTCGLPYGCGTIFGVGPKGGGLILLYPFCSQAVCPSIDALFYPSAQYGQLLQATNGKFYGTASYGGVGVNHTSGNDFGMIYSMSVGLGPFVTFLPAASGVGSVVEILGQGFTGASGVSFNGTAATFTVKSDTYLTATVPAGATTGSITVTEPGGTLTSNKIFRVRPYIRSFSPTSGPVGTTVVITGESLTGATEVIFHGPKRATFTVDSDTQITATVPAGAMTGVMCVYTPSGNADIPTGFTVTP